MGHLIPAIFSVIDEGDSYPMTFDNPVGHVDIINLSTTNTLTVTFTQGPDSFAIPVISEGTFFNLASRLVVNELNCSGLSVKDEFGSFLNVSNAISTPSLDASIVLTLFPELDFSTFPSL